MESGTYGSAHLPSPALVVFSQAAAGGLSEALRIQRPFHSQIPDAKDLHHLSLVGNYGAHLFHNFPPHFLHPLNPAVSSATTTSSPFGSGSAFVKPFPSSLQIPTAFPPPPKFGSLEQGMMFSGNESYRTDSSSPACTSLSPPVKEESLEGHTSEEGERDRICSPQRSPETPGFRPPKFGPNHGAEPMNLHKTINNNFNYRFPFIDAFKTFTSDHRFTAGVGTKKPSLGTPPPNSCPVCGIHLTSADLETHFLAELDRLYKMSSLPERQRIRASFNMNNSMHPSNGVLQGPDNRWETFQRVRTNRQGRLRAKTRKRKGDSESEYPEQLRSPQCQSCPVCHGRLQRTPEEIAQHVEECLRKVHHWSIVSKRNNMMDVPQQEQSTARDDEDETVDVESFGDETSNGAVNLAAQSITHNNNNNNNNNIMKLDQNHSIQRPLSTENGITSLTTLHTPWDRKHRLVSFQCPTTTISPLNPTISRATPTSSDQRTDIDTDRNSTERRNDQRNDNDEEVNVDNTDDEESIKRPRLHEKSPDKPNTEEATSSVEIDSVTDPNNIKSTNLPTPDSYVSTSDPVEPSTRTQVLEELRARIRELEGTTFKPRNSTDEEHYKCYICKEAYRSPVISTVCWHVHCDGCWITLSDTKKSCPQCKIVVTTCDLRKIHV